ncbi:MAG: helix-turn-helix domain-containing protein [Gammaproteobacteria bacterium]|nr:helix-turn-helix domain-containing protein [Gammaproteobacteria bacterium]
MQSTPADLLLTPVQVADQLGLHVRTVRRYIREGQLKAVRVGKRYRVHRQELEAFAGISLNDAASTEKSVERYTEVSSIVGIDSLTKADADRLTKYVMASVQGRERDDRPMRVDTIYDAQRQRLKVVVSGSIASTTVLLALINTLITQKP